MSDGLKFKKSFVVDGVIVKICTQCKIQKPITEFYKNGKETSCSKCCKEYGAKFRLENIDSERARYKKYYDENTEILLERGKRYRENNPDKMEEKKLKQRIKYKEDQEYRIKEDKRSSKWCKDNKERVNELSVIRRSQKMPVEKVLFNNAKNRAKAQNVEFSLKIEDIIVPKFCPILGVELKIGTRYSKSNSPSIDRIFPKGGYTKGNVRIISLRANTIKSDASADELYKVYLYAKESQNVANTQGDC